MAIFYLDIDDEITSAAARIRGTDDLVVVLVLPAGSRIATSRINFRLLAREAQQRSRRLSIVAPDASARALAATAGLPVFASTMEYESSLPQPPAARAEAPDAPTARAAAGGVPPPLSSPDAGAAVKQARRLTQDELAARDATLAGGVTAGPAGGGHARTPDQVGPAGGGRARTPDQVGDALAGHARPPDQVGDPLAGHARPPDQVGDPLAGHARPPDHHATVARPGPSTGLGPERDQGARARPRRARRTALLVAALLIVFLGVVGGAAAYLLLPSASIVLTIRSAPLAPVDFVATADPAATAADPSAAIVPATRLQIPLAASKSFKATGKRVEEAPAVGSVRWTNCDPTRAYTIPQGTLVRTGAGVAFAMDEAIFLPVAILNPPRITCQDRAVGVTAAKDGPAGNVGSGTISVIPGQYNSVVLSARNPAATSGGVHDEFPKVTQKDVTAALTALGKQLDAQLLARAAAPVGLPAGSTAFAETATRGPATPKVDTAALVGQEVAQFDLSVTATGEVVVVDPAPIVELGEARLVAALPSDRDLVAGSTFVRVGPGTVDGQRVHFGVTARADSTARVDESSLRSRLEGRSAAEAQAILAALGDATVALWPGWVTTIPTVDARVELRVEGLAAASPSPAATASPPPAP